MIERLGRTTLSLFHDTFSLDRERTSQSQGNRFGEIDQEYMEWFGMKDHIGPTSDEFPITGSSPKMNVPLGVDQTPLPLFQDQAFNGMMDMEGFFDLGFDMSLPLMRDGGGVEDAFGHGNYST